MNRCGVKVFRVIATILLFGAAYPGLSESLWTPAFSGFITGNPAYDIGDIVRVMINTESSLKYKSSRIDAENVVLEFSGGKSEGLFSFLPKGKASGNVDLRGEESVFIGSSLATRVVARDDSGALQLQGIRSVFVSGAEQSLEIDGWVYPTSIDRERTVNISHLADMQLTYTALIDRVNETITQDDIESSIPADLNTDIAPDTQDPPAEVDPTGTEVPAQPEESLIIDQVQTPPILSLDEEKAEELLLIFINRFLEWVF